MKNDTNRHSGRSPDRATILVVDDEPRNIDVLAATLKADYRIQVAKNGLQALERVRSNKPNLILLDVMMPEMDGYEVCEKLKSDPETSGIPIIFVTGLSGMEEEYKGLDLGAVDYVTKPFQPKLLKARLENHLQLKRHQDELEVLVAERTREISLTQDATIMSLASLAETRDNETGGHIRRTQNYVRSLAAYLQEKKQYKEFLTPRVIDLLYKSAPLHDIGKVGVPDSILLKPGPLDADEWEEMKRHTVYGRNAIEVAEKELGSNSFLRFAREIAYTHHEKWDGSGYPEGLVGEKIPLSGRLMTVADIYDALISKRVYKGAFTHEQAVEIITRGDGRVEPVHFDPLVLEAFEAQQDEFRAIAVRFSE